MNLICLVGRLVRDPEMKTTQGGHSLCRFTIAVDRDFKNEAGEYEADFIDCTAWRNTAEFIDKWFEKGKPIAVTGSLQIRKYQDKEGNNRKAAEVQVDKARFVPGVPKQEQSWHDQVGARPATEVVETSEGQFLDDPTEGDDSKLPFDF